jgi:hypothetical protein
MAIFCGVMFLSDFLSSGVYFAVSWSWCGASPLLVGFLRALRVNSNNCLDCIRCWERTHSLLRP